MAPKPQGRFKRPRKSRAGLLTGLALGVLVLAYVGVLELSRPHVGGERLRFDQLIKLVSTGRIESARILDEDAYVVGNYARPDGALVRFNAPLVRNSQADLLGLLVKAEVPTTIDQQVGKRVASLASILLPGLMITVLFLYLIVSYRKGTGLFGIRSGARRVAAEDAKVTFADVAGQQAAITELKEITQFLTDPERFTALGARVPKGVLLFGPPGCGKTLLARALAGESGAAFFTISGSDFVEVYVGVGASRVRDLFQEARQNAPAVIFIDELDSIGRARAGGGAAIAHGEQEQALNQILAEMDGFSTSEGIIVVGATNRPDVLDPALLRPGRFDRTVGLDRPDEEARLAILSLHAQDKPLAEGADLASVAERAIGLTGADLASVMNEGALLAARAGKREISQAELDQALRRILDAPERQRRLSLRARSIGRRFVSEQRVTFADVAGAGDAIAELGEVTHYLADPDRFARLGARAPRGILLYGPPGCGKTLLGRAVAGEANAAFFSVAGSEFVEVFAGEGASRVRELFAEARSIAPAIVFIDEIDAIGARRGMGVEGHREREQTLNQILVELDGFESRSAVVVMAATNRPDILDPALVRPGRFDRQIEVTLPDRAGRRAILGLHATSSPLAPDVDLDAVAGLTRGLSGAELANVVNEAALLAARSEVDTISMATVHEAVDRALLGLSSRGQVLSDEERRTVAYHEAGHALAGWLLPHASPPHRLTIVARGRSAGHSAHIDSHDRVIRTRSWLMARMAVALAGRAAEELALGESSSGAASDLSIAGGIAREMVYDLGMGPGLGARAFDGRRDYSERSAQAIDTEIDRLLAEADGVVRAALTSARDGLERVAAALLDRETLTADDLERLLGTRPGAAGA